MKDRESVVRLGLIGAGANTQAKHIPGFCALPKVELGSVCNRTRDSSENVARKFNIPKVAGSWKEIVASPEIDAVCIGTWPYLHCEIACAALEAGKHVLCEARMAMNFQEAKTMLETSRRHPELVSQVVPSPIGLKVNSTVLGCMKQGWLGELWAVNLREAGSAFADLEAPLHWRQRRDLNGLNCLSLGIWYETLMRWVGRAHSVSALAKICVARRRDPATGEMILIEIPDHLNVLAEFENGACGNFQFSSITGLHGESTLWLHGSKGILKYDAKTNNLLGGQRGDEALREIPVQPEKTDRWRVEEEFINAIRGKEKIVFTDFETGVAYMEFTEAVHRSWKEGRKIQLPLPD